MPLFRLRTNPIQWLIAAGIFHVFVAVTVFLTGYYELLVNTFDTHGIGISFSIDGYTYRNRAIDLADILRSTGLSAWAATPAPLHCKLMSLSFALFGNLLGYNILGAEPLNLLYYLGVITFVYLLGREIFSPRAGMIAAVIVALWPSYLLHSTQLIRDPLAILCLLGLLFVATLLLGRNLSWRKGIVYGLCGVTLLTTFWLTRANMWNVAIAMVAITFLLFAFRMLRERRFVARNLVGILMLLVASVVVPARIVSRSAPNSTPVILLPSVEGDARPVAILGIWGRILRQIKGSRRGLQSSLLRPPKIPGSNIDTDVRLSTTEDVVKYLPRATIIGLFAPFPKMWLQKSGQAGGAARAVSAVETFLMYLLYMPVVVCLWVERRRLQMWLTFLISLFGLTALGMVVVNAGALYRLRYAFWMMLIVLAAQGILIIASWAREKRRHGT
jgi:hypothetical protein